MDFRDLASGSVIIAPDVIGRVRVRAVDPGDFAIAIVISVLAEESLAGFIKDFAPFRAPEGVIRKRGFPTDHVGGLDQFAALILEEIIGHDRIGGRIVGGSGIFYFTGDEPASVVGPVVGGGVGANTALKEAVSGVCERMHSVVDDVR